MSVVNTTRSASNLCLETQWNLYRPRPPRFAPSRLGSDARRASDPANSHQSAVLPTAFLALMRTRASQKIVRARGLSRAD
eukprot:360120-Chlamydomonas_euryale.AAC.2